jgi:hypothetical protein
MGNKVNSSIFRLSKTKNWKSKHFEKKTTETAIYNFKDLEIRAFVVRFFKQHGLIVNNCRLNYSYDGTVHLFISYVTTFNSTLLIKETRHLQNLTFFNPQTVTRYRVPRAFERIHAKTPSPIVFFKNEQNLTQKSQKKNYKTFTNKNKNELIAELQKKISERTFKKCRNFKASNFYTTLVKKHSTQSMPTRSFILSKIKFYKNLWDFAANYLVKKISKPWWLKKKIRHRQVWQLKKTSRNINFFLTVIKLNRSKHTRIVFFKNYLRVTEIIERRNSFKFKILKEIKNNRLKYVILNHALSKYLLFYKIKTSKIFIEEADTWIVILVSRVWRGGISLQTELKTREARKAQRRVRLLRLEAKFKTLRNTLAKLKIQHDHLDTTQFLLEKTAKQLLFEKIKIKVRLNSTLKFLKVFKFYKTAYPTFFVCFLKKKKLLGLYLLQYVFFTKVALKNNVIPSLSKKAILKIISDFSFKNFLKKKFQIKEKLTVLTFLNWINYKRREKITDFDNKTIKMQRNIRNLLVYKSLFSRIKNVTFSAQLNKNRLKRLKYWKNFLTVKKFENIKTIKINYFLNNLFKSLNLFTNDNSKIRMTLQQLNKKYSKYFAKKQVKEIKLNLMKFHYFKNKKFFEDGVNMLFVAATTKSSAAFIISEFIAEQLPKLEKHHYLLNFVSLSLRRFRRQGFSKHYGIKIQVKGRFNGRPRSKCRYLVIGKRIPFGKINLKIDYSETTAFTVDGSFGIKVWVCYNKGKNYSEV